MIKKVAKKIGGGLGLNEVKDDLGKLKWYSEQITEKLEALSGMPGQIAQMQERLEQLEWQNKYLRKQVALQYESLATIAGGRVADDRQRFFQTISPAHGELRIFQLGCAKLMQKLMEICEKNGLRLWMHSGTLLGAVRNQGFIPWDDDTDMAMMRDDIKQLRQILEHDAEYQLALNYDYYCKSRQLRFRTRDPENPCFVDVFINDYSDEIDIEKEREEWVRRKAEITEKFERNESPAMQAWREKGVINEFDEYGDELKALFNEYFPEPETPKNRKSKSVTWGLDNLDTGGPRLFMWETIFPVTGLRFENQEYPAPRDYKLFLRRMYGDYLEIPKDLVSHFQHSDSSAWDIDAIERFLQK